MMQARLQSNRFPTLFAVVLFALTAAVVLGGALGYTLRASSSSSGSSQAISQHNAAAGTNTNAAESSPASAAAQRKGVVAAEAGLSGASTMPPADLPAAPNGTATKPY
jgi:hypothetical protein